MLDLYEKGHGTDGESVAIEHLSMELMGGLRRSNRESLTLFFATFSWFLPFPRVSIWWGIGTAKQKVVNLMMQTVIRDCNLL